MFLQKTEKRIDPKNVCTKIKSECLALNQLDEKCPCLFEKRVLLGVFSLMRVDNMFQLPGE